MYIVYVKRQTLTPVPKLQISMKPPTVYVTRPCSSVGLNRAKTRPMILTRLIAPFRGIRFMLNFVNLGKCKHVYCRCKTTSTDTRPRIVDLDETSHCLSNTSMFFRGAHSCQNKVYDPYSTYRPLPWHSIYAQFREFGQM